MIETDDSLSGKSKAYKEQPRLYSNVETDNLTDIELNLLTEAIYAYRGFDFRDYARESLQRRVFNLMELEGLATISALQEKVLHEKSVMERFLLAMSINVTDMFRDPETFLIFREKVIPILRTYPSIRIWHAGCSTGEEVYSLAILLEEEHLIDKTQIYATDINEAVLKTAKQGVYPLSVMQGYTNNYMKAGGKRAFSEYYHASHEHIIFKPSLRDRVVFARHNLVSDASFNEFNVIFCRNVMIYFNENLQNRVNELIYNSLCRFGVLVLGSNESVDFSPRATSYKNIDQSNCIYQRVS